MAQAYASRGILFNEPPPEAAKGPAQVRDADP